MAYRGANAATIDQVYNVEGAGSDSGFPNKDTSFSKIEKYSDSFSDDREGKIIDLYRKPCTTCPIFLVKTVHRTRILGHTLPM